MCFDLKEKGRGGRGGRVRREGRAKEKLPAGLKQIFKSLKVWGCTLLGIGSKTANSRRFSLVGCTGEGLEVSP